ncbi:alkene reductase [Aquimarina sp. BL5]|uniref:alkene reductase n=1 Tax=Aquimarina sp. BL5 TaxID=1714860 RepID=UPI000E4E8381|nr:alkene reductase [Aquimarina sp. BL5]AXT52578.1 alkene reductase [Aquimarina sp. BL5]RKN11236.1 alkene reductase [Aquimarina sp. BL5]
MNLFEEYNLGDIELKNRVVMAPLTRSRAENNIPNELMAKYYKQRASAGLIISEGTSPSPDGIGYSRIPGAYSDEQIEGWKKIADAVHAEGGKIFVQLMHTGRISAKANMPEGSITIAPSSIQAPGEISTDTEDGMVPHDMPKEMTLKDIERIQNEFVSASKRLINEAMVDGVELHAANGYLLNQFLNPKSNQRTDHYGGSVLNRTRFVIEIAQKVTNEIDGNKVGLRVSPYGEFNDMKADYEDLEDTFIHLAKELSILNLAYMHIVDQRVAFGAPDFTLNIKKIIKDNFKGTVISGGDVNTREKAEAILENGLDLVYIGRPFISNPNMVEKLRTNQTLVDPNPDTFYTPGEVGYTDY